MWPIGTWSSRRPGCSGIHIARETWPCSDDTALARRESLERQHRHAELLVLVLGIDAPERHHVVVRQPERVAQGPEMFLDQRRREPVVTRRHRRVRGEDDLCGDTA